MKAIKLNRGSTKIIPALLVIFIITCLSVQAQDEDFNPDSDRAERSFDAGDYSTALKHYKALREKFIADPVYAYYTGACMVELRQDPREATKLLKEAILNSSAIRAVPDRAWYYLGRAYQQAGDFDLAVDAWDNFRETARRREIRELDIDGLIDECIAGKGDLEEGEEAGLAVGEEAADGKAAGIDKSGREIMAEAVVMDAEQDHDKPDTAKVAGEAGEGVEPGQNPGADYESLAREALELQFMADSVLRLADIYRANLAELAETDKQSLRTKILSLEQSGFEYQRAADRKYKEAARMASEKYDKEILPELRKMEEELPLRGGQFADSLRNDGREPGHTEADEQVAEGDETEQEETAKPDNDTTGTATELADSLTAISRPDPVLEVFSENYEQEGDIPVNPELPPGLFYKIQVAAFRNPKPLSFFNNLGPVSISRAEGSDVNFYFIGMFRTKQAAEKALVKVRRKGFSDAFILALMDGERISMEKAEQLEESWSDISLFSGDALPDSQKPEEVEPPTLVYRVRVLKTKEKIEDERLEQLERLAESRTYDVFETDAGEYVYLIGNFLTFESAASYADLLYRNGMKEAEVAAYMGKKEIPLKTAKELFDMYFEK
ncbi:MAG: SPOR domain-containing protein [Bacteroidales bacterium]|nr:SPOR domain-containing protein [Bacteroidales bacterium]